MGAPCASVAPRLREGFDSIPKASELFARLPDLRIDQDEYNINVTVGYGETLNSDIALGAFDSYRQGNSPIHVYFHIPLCKYICHFCNYVKKRVSGGAEEANLWTELLLTEAEAYLQNAEWLGSAPVESVYLGGGTATTLGIRNLEKLLSFVRRRFSLVPSCEITLEGNPDDFTDGFAASAQSIGFNRFSIGIQSLDQNVNKFAGRGHTPEMSLNALKGLLATKAPFNADIMFGLPQQNIMSSSNDIESLAALGVPTITIYRFRNADRQALGIGNASLWNRSDIQNKLHSRGSFLNVEETYDIRRQLVRLLREAGYTASPCGWWSLPHTYPDGNIPQVSKNKWENHNTMAAFGPGAYGWLTSDSTNQLQTHNEANIDQYLKRRKSGEARPLASARKLDRMQSVATDLGFAFKARQPIPLQRYRRRYDIDLLKDDPCKSSIMHLIDAELIRYDAQADYLYPTDLGEFVHEEIISRYIHTLANHRCAPICNK